MLSFVFENNKAVMKLNGNPIFDFFEIEINYRTGKKATLTPVKEEKGKITFSKEGGDCLCLYGIEIDSAIVLKIEGALIHDHTLEPTAFAESDSFSLHFKSAAAKGIMANYQHSPWWTRPAFADKVESLPNKTISLLMDMGDNQFVHAYPMCDDIYKTHIVGDGDYARLVATIGCDGHSQVDGVLMAVGAGDNPYQTVHDTMAVGFSAVKEPIPLKEERSDIEALNLLGWCTYDAFYREVTHDKIIEKLKEFKEKNIPIKMLLIDSGWFVHNGDGTKGNGIVDLRANPEKFPKGLKGLIDEVKSEYGIEKVGIWHGLPVMWQGVEKGSFAWSQTRDFLCELNSGMCYPSLEREKAFGFYNYWHSYLKREGIDFIKVDLQGEVTMYSHGIKNVNQAAKDVHAGFEASAALHFGGDVINCMGMPQENVQSRLRSGVARNSDDFFPNKENGFSEHFLQNGYNSVYHGQIYFCDFDMWWTKHESAHQSAILRAVSGGPVYVSDQIGNTIPDELIRLADGKGELYRCDLNGTICRDNLFSDPSKDGTVAKMFNRSGDAGLVAAFNTDSQGNTVSGFVKAADAENIDGDEFLCYLSNSNTFKLVKKEENIPLTLNKNEGELAVYVPVKDGFAAFGLTEKYVSPATVIYSEPDFALITEGGSFAFYSKKEVKSVLANGTEVAFESVGDGIYVAQIPQAEGDISVEIE